MADYGARHTKKGFCSAGLVQPEWLSLINQLAEQDKQVNKSLLFKLFGMMKSSYYYGLKPKPISLEAVKTKALIRRTFNDSKHSADASSIAAIMMNEHGIKLTHYNHERPNMGNGGFTPIQKLNQAA